MIRFFGIYVNNEDVFIVTEFMLHGDLKQFLKKEKQQLQLKDLLQMCGFLLIHISKNYQGS